MQYGFMLVNDERYAIIERDEDEWIEIGFILHSSGVDGSVRQTVEELVRLANKAYQGEI